MDIIECLKEYEITYKCSCIDQLKKRRERNLDNYEVELGRLLLLLEPDKVLIDLYQAELNFKILKLKKIIDDLTHVLSDDSYIQECTCQCQQGRILD